MGSGEMAGRLGSRLDVIVTLCPVRAVAHGHPTGHLSTAVAHGHPTGHLSTAVAHGHPTGHLSTAVAHGHPTGHLSTAAAHGHPTGHLSTAAGLRSMASGRADRGTPFLHLAVAQRQPIRVHYKVLQLLQSGRRGNVLTLT